jgi:hypothetical protein
MSGGVLRLPASAAGVQTPQPPSTIGQLAMPCKPNEPLVPGPDQETP